MFAKRGLQPILFSKPAPRLLKILQDLNLTANLKLCLDVGDINSYPGGQSWLDTSGNGYDFFRGATNSATTDDPTFNGNLGGLSQGEYWSFDGGDYFRYDTTNETWMQNIHKDNAKFTLAIWVYKDSAATGYSLAGTRGAAAGNTGFSFFKLAAGTLTLLVQNAGTSVASPTTSGTVPDGWSFLAVSLDEAIGASGAVFQINGSQELLTSTYTLPASGNASFTMEIAARGNADTLMSNLNRVGSFVAWEGTALTSAELMSVYQKTRIRLGV